MPRRLTLHAEQRYRMHLGGLLAWLGAGIGRIGSGQRLRSGRARAGCRPLAVTKSAGLMLSGLVSVVD
jgi:hypothetical protein